MYHQSWFIWISFVVVGFLLFRYSEQISLGRRDKRKSEEAGAGMMAIGIIFSVLALIFYIKETI
jgi:hypothetical protein